MIMGWTIPLQHAAYRGVRFDVITITDNIERAVVEHAYPFVDGADLEDMGRQPRQVQLQAVFFGKDYRIGLDKFMTTLQQSGADVLVHPIFGRMPNMLCTSASIRHGDDFVDYATLDLTFIEATQLKPIFAFEQNLWSEIDRLINALEAFEDTVIALYGQFMHSVALAHHAKTRMLRVWSALVGVYESTLLMFGVTSHQYAPSAGVHFQQFERDTVKVVKAIGEIIAQELANIASPISGQSATKKQRNASTLFDETQSDTSSILTVKSRFDEVLREALLVKNLPQELVSGKNNSVKRASKLAALVSTFSYADMRETECAVQLMLATTIMRIGIEMIEAHADSLLPSDIEYIAQQSRLAIVEAIKMVRQLQKQDMTI